MDEALVARWNEAVAPDDTVWHLGDFAVRVDARARRRPARRPPRHQAPDRRQQRPARDPGLPGWASVHDYAELELDGRRLVLCHYPLRAWNGQHRGALQLHGHSHGRLKPLPRQFDVGVDACAFRPVELTELTMRRRPRGHEGQGRGR